MHLSVNLVFLTKISSRTNGRREAFSDIVRESCCILMALSVAVPFAIGLRPAKFGLSGEVDKY